MGEKKTGFHVTVFVFVSISNGKNDKLSLGNASADSCVLLLNISGDEVGGRCVYIARKILCKTLRGPGSDPLGNSFHPFHSYPLLFILSKGKGTRKGDLTERCCRPPSSPRSQVASLVHKGTRHPSAASPQSCMFPWMSKQALTLSSPRPFRGLHPALSPPGADADIFFLGGRVLCSQTERSCILSFKNFLFYLKPASLSWTLNLALEG